MTKEATLSDISQLEGADGADNARPGTIYALSVSGGVRFWPQEGRQVHFGRNRPEVHVCVGEDDQRVSRTHGVVTYTDDRWWLVNQGHLTLQLPGSLMLFQESDPFPLEPGYTPVFIASPVRQHLLELYVADDEGRLPRPAPGSETLQDKMWKLTVKERLVVVALGRRYLMHEASPQPVTWAGVAETLREARPGERWTARGVEGVVGVVRKRLSRAGVPGLTRKEVGEPVGNLLNHNLMLALLRSRTLAPPDLSILNLDLDG